ncbi:protein phosphatase regulator SHP1 [Sugiyamaella lignohabitans]|uniref:Protein phosphatase regulator SHP1 n=1 Tax=Sugiyamaella lignohabitans TaxID=796027 RepID=A0A167D7G4_9ASCO|nr:protein phosphatase regulator SHP1 [Sugiyamaella lignohabitans]ANB12574.1 protein phosphatase regulator SHP1 [Sugiyamaella lignohabitans]
MSEPVQEPDQNQLVAEFVNVTQCSPDEAQELLELSHWNLECRGGEKSGLAVQNPDGAGSSSGRLISNIFRQAQRNQAGGAPKAGDDYSDEDDEFEEDYDDIPGGGSFSGFNRGRKSGKKSNKFTGTGFTLGSDEVPSRTVEDPSSLLKNSRPQRVVRQLTFWKNGFSVEDGPLYRYDDPQNVAHLEAINSGKAPLSLLNVENGQGVDVRIVRKMDENYAPPKKLGGFHGQGNRLGSPVPGDISLSNSASSSTANLSSSSSVSALGTASGTAPASGLGASGDAPVQIRLGDGRALRARFESTGSVQQLYDYVQSAQSSTEARNFVLQTTFPNKELLDREISLKEAGAVGAVVIQKWV